MSAGLQAWVGRLHSDHDVATLRQARLMAATVDHAAPLAEGDALPPLWHWLYFLEGLPPAQLGRDGHPARGGFLPPVPLPNRMWAGGRVSWHAPVPLGAAIEKRAQVTAIVPKRGRSGDLVFVTVRHEVWCGGALAIEEEQDLVYRDTPPAGRTATIAPTTGSHGAAIATLNADATLLFRYSALTFNGHRIHYDVDYCREVEGYAGLVIHGPLHATWLAGLATLHLGRPLARYSYRALAPATAPQTLTACVAASVGGEVTLDSVMQDGRVAMRAEAWG